MAVVANNNYEQLVNAQGLGSTTHIVSIAKGTGDATEAQLVAVLKAMEMAGFTTAGFTAAALGTDSAYAAMQGSGTISAVAGTYGTDITVTTLVTFAS